MAKAFRKRRQQYQAQPGRQALPENSIISDGNMHGIITRGRNYLSLRPEQPKRPGPKVSGNARLSRADVWGKLESAMRTLRAMPDRERRFFAVKSGYPDFVRDYIDAYASADAIAPRYQPSPQEVSEYLDILAWTRHLEQRDWKLLWWRSFGLSFGIIADYIGRSDETARKRFENALTDVWTAANGI